MSEGRDKGEACGVLVLPGETCPQPYTYEAKLVFPKPTGSSSHFGLVAPTIKTINTTMGDTRIDEPPMILEINGLFGSVEGEVYVNEVELDLFSWTPEQILAAIPANGDGAAGIVTVRVNGTVSNALPLTAWRGVFNWEHDLIGELWPGAVAEYECDLHIRAGFQSYVDVFYGPIITPPAVPLYDTQNSQCTWTMSGEWTDGDGSLHRLEGSGTLRWRALWDPPEQVLVFDAGILPKERKIQAQIAGIDHGTVKVFNESGELTSQYPEPVGGTHLLTLPLDSDFNIIAGTERGFGQWGGVEHLVWWSDISL